MARHSSLPIHLRAYVEEEAAPPRKWIPREREDDVGEFGPPELDPDMEPDAGLSHRAYTRRTEGPEGSPRSGGFVAFRVPRDLVDAADVGISGLGVVTWMSGLELRAPQMYTLLILILNLEKGKPEVLSEANDEDQRRPDMKAEWLGGWEWFP
jgi:hypothetical protein